MTAKTTVFIEPPLIIDQTQLNQVVSHVLQGLRIVFKMSFKKGF